MPLPSQIVYFALTLFFLWLTAISILLLKARATYKKLTANVKEKDLIGVLKSIKKQLDTIDGDLDDFRAALRDTNKSMKSYLQKMGFVRFNPFGNTGGDQSFCLCLLDQQDNGILITSLHARDQTRIYTKEIKNGHPADKSALSKEEAQCLKNALKWSQRK